MSRCREPGARAQAEASPFCLMCHHQQFPDPSGRWADEAERAAASLCGSAARRAWSPSLSGADPSWEVHGGRQALGASGLLVTFLIMGLCLACQRGNFSKRCTGGQKFGPCRRNGAIETLAYLCKYVRQGAVRQELPLIHRGPSSGRLLLERQLFKY